MADKFLFVSGTKHFVFGKKHCWEKILKASQSEFQVSGSKRSVLYVSYGEQSKWRYYLGPPGTKTSTKHSHERKRNMLHTCQIFSLWIFLLLNLSGTILSLNVWLLSISLQQSDSRFNLSSQDESPIATKL